MDDYPGGCAPVSEDEKLLFKNKDFSWLTRSEASELVREFPVRSYKRNDTVFDSRLERHKGHIYVLLSGRVNLISYSKRNGATVIAMVPPGLIPKVPASFREIGNSYTYTAATSCKIMKISVQKFLAMLVRLKEVDISEYESILDNLSGTFEDLLLRYRSFFGLDLLTRVTIAFLRLAEDFGIANGDSVIIPRFFNHDDVADLVGASRPRVTNAIKSLEAQKIIGRQGPHIRVNLLVLRNFVSANV
jgi:CRP/FNR family transcriptional regulator, cyclic AMP receptor protein